MNAEIEAYKAAIDLIVDDDLWAYRNDDNELVFTINVNDVFVPAGDSEDVTLDEVVELHKRAKTDEYALVRWVMEKRGMQPRDRFRERMEQYDREQAA